MLRRNVSPSLSEIAVQRDSVGSGEKVIYMGDSANWKYCVHEVGNPFQASTPQAFFGDMLHQSVMDHLGHDSQKALEVLQSQDEELLTMQGVFNHPKKLVRDQLIRCFFEFAFPACPILHYDYFMRLYTTEKLSPLLLNAVLFMSIAHCDAELLQILGFATRYLASFSFYRRAKALYDAGHESDGIATVQAVILLSHWSGGPMEQKDTWHWLGVASAMAQSLGIHRA